ncbi:MAG: ABC transporter permease [Deltaproteobacteria bacterium]|nr:ABC transporter permease [Deltaproteobacteria bacterium]MBN2670633.1 ABC transporter permease [Deltaproteobacteria bacterium]
MDYSTFIGSRYIKSKKKRTISAITFIAITGVALGVGALSAVLCISSGFQDEFTRKVLGVNAHVLIMKYGMDFREYRKVMDGVKKVQGVKASEPFVIQEMMISKDDHSAGVLLKGIDPQLVGEVLDLPRHIVDGGIRGLRLEGVGPPKTSYEKAKLKTRILHGDDDSGDDTDADVEDDTKSPEIPEAIGSEDTEAAKSAASDTTTGDDTDEAQPDLGSEDVESKNSPLPGIIIGKTLAENLGAKVGDTVQITTPLIGLDMLGWSPSNQAPKFIKFKIVGIFYAGFLEYDTKLVFVDYYQAQRFFNHGDSVTGVELVVSNMNRAQEVADSIDELLKDGPYRTVDWEELNKPLFTALKTQKLAFTVLLSIIVGVAAFNIIATLVMMVFDKRKEIAILKSMGASHLGIMRIFLHAGTVVGSVGIGIGLAVGFGVCFLLDEIGWPLDPEVYLIDHLPVTMDWVNFVSSAAVAFLICIVATAIPSLTASLLRPVNGLRED